MGFVDALTTAEATQVQKNSGSTGAGGLVLDSNFDALNSRIGKCNYTAGAAPAVTDDSSAGYSVNSLWLYAGTMYICLDAYVGAAEWITYAPLASPAFTGTVSATQSSAVTMSQTWYDSASTLVGRFGEFASGIYGLESPAYYLNYAYQVGFQLQNGIGLAFKGNSPGAGDAIQFLNTAGSINPTSGTSEGVLFYDNGFNPTSGTAVHYKFNLSGSVNQTGGANGITAGLLIGVTVTAAADWRSIQINPNVGYAIYQSGSSATNYFAGNVGIGTTPSAAQLDVAGSVKISQVLNLATYTNSSPTDGDLWYDGTNLKFRQGSTTKTITWT